MYYHWNRRSDLEIFLAARNHVWVQSAVGVWLVAATLHVVNVSHMRKPGSDPDFKTYFWLDEDDNEELAELYDGYGWNLQILNLLIERCESIKRKDKL